MENTSEFVPCAGEYGVALRLTGGPLDGAILEIISPEGGVYAGVYDGGLIYTKITSGPDLYEAVLRMAHRVVVVPATGERTSVIYNWTKKDEVSV